MLISKLQIEQKPAGIVIKATLTDTVQDLAICKRLLKASSYLPEAGTVKMSGNVIAYDKVGEKDESKSVGKITLTATQSDGAPAITQVFETIVEYTDVERWAQALSHRRAIIIRDLQMDIEDKKFEPNI